MKLTIEDGRDSFYTFDTNRILLLTATDEEQINQVEFSTEENGETVSWTSDVLTGEDGIKYVQVPNEFLNGNYSRLVCYYVALDSKGEYTRQKEVFRIRARQEPEDYFLTYSERVTFASIKALTEQYKVNASNSADLARRYAEESEDVNVEAGTYSSKHWSAKSEKKFQEIKDYIGSSSNPESALGSIESARASAVSDVNKQKTDSIEAIGTYTSNTAIPSISQYVEGTTKPALKTYGEQQVDSYVDGTSKPELDRYVNNEKKQVLDNYTSEKKSELDNYTETDKKQVLDSYTENEKKAELDSHTEGLKEQLNAHTLAKSGELNEYTTGLKSELDGYTTAKEQDISEFTEQKKAEVQGVYQNDLNELKGDLDVVDSRLSESIMVIDEAVFEKRDIPVRETVDGWKLVDSGLSSSDSSFKLVKFNAEPNKKYKVTTNGMWQFQTAIGVPSSEPSNRTGETIAGIGYCISPSNAKYLIVSCTKEFTPTVEIVEHNKVDVNSYWVAVNKSRLDSVTGDIPISSIAEFELGDRYVNSSGVLTYYDSTTRIRSKKDTYIDLKKGNVVGLRTYDQYRLLIYKYNENDDTWVSVSGGWSNKDVRIDNDGKYAILLQKDTPETIINIEDYTSKLYIKKYGVLPTITNIEAKNEIFTDEVIATVNSVRAKTTSRALMFGVITDTHYDGKRTSYYDQSMENLERVSRQLGLDAIVHLGDIINGYESKDIVKEQLQSCIEKLVKCGARNTFVLIGNHDNDNGAGDSNRLTDAELYSITQRHNESYVNRSAINLESNSIYNAISDNYYVDYPTFKIRLIMFNSCYYSQGFSDETIAWVRTTITSSPSDYKFVFMTHESTEKELNGGNALGNATTFKNLLAQYKDRILCYIHGHSHYDYVGYTNEFAQISICCAVPDQPVSNLPSGATQPTREIGTVTQDCFDIVIILPDENKVECVRFGAGNDRTIPFRSN